MNAKFAVKGWWNMAEVTWFKVLTDIFADDKIKILQSMPEGDSLLVMWFKVLSQAGKTNDGGYIYLKKNIPYTFGMFATLFGKQQQLVELAMRTFTEFGMIDIDDNGYVFVTNWEKHQSIDALEKIKEQDRIRSLNYRERKRLELKGNHVTVTLSSQANHATDLELELDLELDKEKDKKSSGNSYQNVFGTYEREIGKLTETVKDLLIDYELFYSEEWVKQSIITAVKQDVKKLSYIEGTLKKWKLLNHDEPWTLEKGAIANERNEQGSTGIHGKSATPLTDLYAISS